MSPTDLESTAALLRRVREGDRAARDSLLARYVPLLRRWARGRLPAGSRDLSDTDDLVQVTLIRAMNRLREFEPRREGAFLAYLRSILLNAIREEIRRSARRPHGDDLRDEIRDAGPTPLETVMGNDTLQRYEAAMTVLTQEQQEAVILRVEMGFSHQQIADALMKASPDAARMVVTRALTRLAEAMDE